MVAVGMPSRRALAPLALGCLGLVAAGCSGTPDHVSVPVSNWPGYEDFYLAEQAGLARAQVVNLELEAQRSRAGLRPRPRVGEWQVWGA